METRVRAALKQRRLILVSALVVVVSKLVVDHAQLVIGLLDAHLDAQILTAIETPCAGVANDVAVGRLREH